METRNFDNIATSLAATQTRRQTLRLFGAAVLGASGAGLLAAGSEAKRHKRRRKSRKQKQDAPPAPEPFVDVAIPEILVEPTSETAHDNLVVQYVNNGTLTASGFRIGMTAKRTNGQIRNEVFSVSLTLAPGESGTETFRLGCNWLNGGAVTARTDPTPVAGEASTATGDNQLVRTFAADICT